ncbi:MAG: hypothetical protein ABIP51_12480, partial [Bacteroidia bacterium]
SLILSSVVNSSVTQITYCSKSERSYQTQNSFETLLARKWVLKTKTDFNLNDVVQNSTTYVNPKYNALVFCKYYWISEGSHTGWWMYYQSN